MGTVMNRVSAGGTVYPGPDVFLGNVILNGTGVNLANAATSGFVWIHAVAGPPTGVPSPLYTGTVPMCYDITNNFLYIYNGGWKKSTVYA